MTQVFQIYSIILLANNEAKYVQISAEGIKSIQIFGETWNVLSNDPHDLEKYIDEVMELSGETIKSSSRLFLLHGSTPKDVVDALIAVMMKSEIFSGALSGSMFGSDQALQHQDRDSIGDGMLSGFCSAFNCLYSDVDSSDYDLMVIKKQRLENEIRRLEAQKAQLESRISHLDDGQLERLIAFFHAIFEDFWKKVDPRFLADVVGLNRPPTIRHHYEMDVDMIALRKRQFEQLPEKERHMVIVWAEGFMNYGSLKIRPAFRDLITRDRLPHE